MQKCPCNSEKEYSSCCGPYLTATSIPTTPEQLMRSRYSAFVTNNIDYIIQTMKGPALKRFNKESAMERSQMGTWLGLDVIKAADEGMIGWVEFTARYLFNGEEQCLHEISEFHCIQGKWYYWDAKITNNTSLSIGRNEACICGSGLKYKKCCLKR